MEALKTKPYESKFLSVCSFFIFPFDEIPKPRGEKSNNYQPYLVNFREKPGHEFFAPGNNRKLCEEIWYRAVEPAVFATRSRQNPPKENFSRQANILVDSI